MPHALYTPDRAIVAALRRLDPGLSVDWVEPGRWAVFHDLPHYGNVDGSASALARETARDFRLNGHEVPYHVCLMAAHKLIQDEKLVCVVQEPDGSYRPLDHRIVSHLARLDWQRRNWWVEDYLSFARKQGDENQRRQREQIDEVWTTLRGDLNGYVDRHNHSFSATALKRIAERERQYEATVLAAS